jgi:hypothetical protein
MTRSETHPDTRCACGAVIVQPTTGRRRVVCSGTCRARRQDAHRKLRRWTHWMRGWRDLAARGSVTIEDAAREVAALEADIQELRASMGQP